MGEMGNRAALVRLQTPQVTQDEGFSTIASKLTYCASEAFWGATRPNIHRFSASSAVTTGAVGAFSEVSDPPKTLLSCFYLVFSARSAFEINDLPPHQSEK
jgi:hypothetical protein